ncbi:Methyltransferase type 11 [Thermodesulfobium narugense DSM 14796]|uniref:Methyltransferase type 11 n=1 Tax=Thermodesulfobium narugense DSM 14796 TaxID=747365 RepID=M1E5J7_9BACT|nr:class I SAM-dependent methyltransferase [Thermodesulfobium narugense]AEE13753.1 Methyltransferase type 11 [Thermodesulfobium narugense DSM 14796]
MNTWDPENYDNKVHFVSEFGKEVLKLLSPMSGEIILDLGCGTGDLTYEIYRLGAIPIGVDCSTTMIERARKKYPEIKFFVDFAESFRLKDPVDAVFSNAVLHWVKKASLAIESIYLALKGGGRFVAEFGGRGNVDSVIKAICKVLSRYEIDAAKLNPWFYPSVEEYASLLENQGFKTIEAYLFDRPTRLKGKEKGLRDWLDIFFGVFFEKLSLDEKEEAYKSIEEILRPTLFIDGNWVVDYVRLRVKAVKI